MRASEFLQEEKGLRFKHTKGKAPHVHQAASPGHVRSKGYYDMYRATMAMAGMDKDGNNEHMPDPESWIGGDGLVNAFTDEERDMSKKAFCGTWNGQQGRRLAHRQSRTRCSEYTKPSCSIQRLSSLINTPITGA